MKKIMWRMMSCVVLSSAFMLILGASSHLAVADDAQDVAALHKRFSETMTGAKLTGKFTIDGKDVAPKEESYTIEKVTWLDIDDLWRFDVHMKYGNVDKTFALAVPVKWAGDTAVISLTKTTIPGMGSFSARVVIDGDRYAGTWDHHGAGGGHMFGRIEKNKDEDSQ